MAEHDEGLNKKPPDWMRPAGFFALILGLLGFVASFCVGGGGSFGGSVVAGLLSPLFFIGVPLGLYWLHHTQRVVQPSRPLLKGAGLPDKALKKSPAPTKVPTIPPELDRPMRSDSSGCLLAITLLGGIAIGLVFGVAIGASLVSPNHRDFTAAHVPVRPNGAQSWGVDRIESPNVRLALTGREEGKKDALLVAHGGDATTEEAVRLGLEWLKRQQMRDGGWSMTGPYPDAAYIENRCAATAMALLAFQGAGHTHVVGDFQSEVKRGSEFLLKMQNKDGFFEHEGGSNQRMYAQAQASIAICELYGMTKDEQFKRPAQLALDFVHNAQAPEGGWRYQPQIGSDVSVTGWYVMALQTGMMAGLEVERPRLHNVHKFLDSCTKDGVHYSYLPGESGPRPAMTAEALLCRQYLGWDRDDERIQAAIEYLLANPIDYGLDENVYYWYYATQAIHNMDGDGWNRWNETLREAIPARQIKTENDLGSWDPRGDRWGTNSGRLYTTCFSIYTLEAYYRHLPVYR